MKVRDELKIRLEKLFKFIFEGVVLISIIAINPLPAHSTVPPCPCQVDCFHLEDFMCEVTDYLDAASDWLVGTAEDIAEFASEVGSNFIKITTPRNTRVVTPTSAIAIRGTAIAIDNHPMEGPGQIITLLKGEGEIIFRDTEQIVPLQSGDSIFIPRTHNLVWPTEFQNGNVRPSCYAVASGFNSSGKRFVNLSVRDPWPGLEGISVNDLVNAKVFIEGEEFFRGSVKQFPPFSFSSVVLEVSEIDPGQPVRVDMGIGDGIGATACDVITRNVNNFLTLKNPLIVSYDPNDPRAPAGVFKILATFFNKTEEGEIQPAAISNMFFEVSEISSHAALLNIISGDGRKGSKLLVHSTAFGEEGVLLPRETFEIYFEVALHEQRPFRFFVNGIGHALGPFAEQGLLPGQ